MTSLAAERAEQARWKLLPEFAGLEVFDWLVSNEFTPPQQAAAAEAQALGAVVRFAALQVPYYRALFARLGLSAADIRDRRDLVRLPVLTRENLRDAFEQLKPDMPLPGCEIAGTVKSSGTTGTPAQVLFSVLSNQMFTYLNQRHLRWFKRDPMGKLLTLRGPANMPQPAPGRSLANGEFLRTNRWTHVGVFFETGPNVFFNYTNPYELQLALLRQERPDYLVTRGHCLEHLLLAAAGETPCTSLRAMTGVSEALTPRTRRYLESCYGAAVQQAYGLNEIGMVAAPCEGGRHHVHRELCIVEIVDDAGVPVAPGENGRVVITALLNAAMPLLRYDADDLATALDGPCPCGRTLPSFGEIHGRRSRIKALPTGTLGRVSALRTALQEMPVHLLRNLRRYQIHQFRDGRFELKVMTAGALLPTFHARMAGAWSAAAGAGAAPLAIREVDEIPLHTFGTKFDDFVSDHF